MKVIVCVVCSVLVAGSTVCEAQRSAGKTFGGPVRASGGAANSLPSSANPVGWRGDGTGRYPGANIPLEWSCLPDSPLADLRCQAAKPKGTQAGGRAVEGFTFEFPDPPYKRLQRDKNVPAMSGGIREWLVIGPFPSKDAAKALDEEQMPGEEKIQPDKGDKAGGLVWEEGWFNKVKLSEPGQVAYVHTYLYCDTPGSVEAAVRQDKGVKVWVNGKVVTSEAKEFTAGYARWIGHYGSWPLNKGWNGVLIKLCRGENAAKLDFWLRPGDAGYRVKNMRWIAKMPHHVDFHRDASCPIIVGEKIFVMTASTDLVCVNRKDGKILWIRPNDYFSILPESQKAEFTAEQKAKLENLKPVAEKLRAINEEIIKDLNAQVGPAGIVPGKSQKNIAPIDQKLKEVKRKLEDQLYSGMGSIDSKKYVRRYQTFGLSSQTPCSDGKRVYFWSSTGVAAAYDLDGNLQWSDIHNTHSGSGSHHGDYGSPIIIGDRMIMHQTHNSTAYDCKTGKILWRNKGGKGDNIYTSPIAVKVGNEDAFFCWTIDTGMGKNQGLYKASDGSTIWEGHLPGIGEAHWTCGTPVLVGDILYNFEETGAFGVKMGSPAKLEMHVKCEPMGLPCGSPVYHDGLLYCTEYFGTLRAYDVNKKEVVWETQPDYYPRDGSRVMIACAASPVLAGKNLYFFDNTGTTIVLNPGRKYEPIAKNRIARFIGAEQMEQFVCSPAVDGDIMVIRGNENLYCIGAK